MRNRNKFHQVLFWIMLVVLASGGLLVAWSVRVETQWIKSGVLRRALQFGQTIPPNRIKTLREDPASGLRLEHQELKQQLMAAQGMYPEWGRILLTDIRDDGSVSLLIDSVAPEESDPYFSATLPEAVIEGMQSVFAGRHSDVAGPFRDPRGTWAYAYVPLSDPKSGRSLAVLGIEVDAKRWRMQILGSAIAPVLTTLFLVLILLVTIWTARRRQDAPEGIDRRWRHQEVVLIHVAGLVLSLLATERVHHYEQRNLRELFALFSLSEFEHVSEAFLVIERTKLEGLGRFVEASDFVDEEEFERYVGHLQDSLGVSAWGWSPVVASAARGDFDRRLETSHGHGLPGIWEPDRDGVPTRAEVRELHYPALYLSHPAAAAAAGYHRGMDLASVPSVASLFTSVQQTGGVRASIPIVLGPAGAQGARHVLICRPTFVRGTDNVLSGFVFAVVDPDALLQSLVAGVQRQNFLRLELFQLGHDAPPVALASMGEVRMDAGTTLELPADPFVYSVPILAFGSSYALVTTPSRAFKVFGTNSLHWIVFLVGVVVTVSVATVVNVIAYRREQLWELVDRRTADLAASLARQDELAMQSRTVMWEVDAVGRYTRVGKVVEDLLGYAPEELTGRRTLCDLHPEGDRESLKASLSETFAQKALISETVRPLVAKSGGTVWVVTNGIPLLGPDGTLLGYQGSDKDITDRWCAEQSLAESEQKYRMLTENMSDVVWVMDAETLQYRYVSPSIHKLLGFSAEEALALPCASEWVVAADREHFNMALLGYCNDFVQGKIRPDEFFTLEFQMLRSDRSPIWAEMAVRFVRDSRSGKVEIHGVTRNSTSRKLAEQYHELDIELLRLFEESSPLDTLFTRSCALIHERIGVDAAGIRMRSGDDYPYAALSGSLCPDHNGLAVLDFDSKPIRNAQGVARLKCLCGLVLSGNLNSDTSLFTAAGSVWSNDVRQLMGLPCIPGDDSFCAKGGTGSIALIPIREKKAIIGLLQIVDHRKDRFSPESIEILESIAGHIGEALMRRRAERDYRLLFNGMVEGFALQRVLYDDHHHPVDCVFIAVNPQFERMTGLSRSAIEGRKASEVLEWSELVWIPTYGKVATTGEPITFRHLMASKSRHFEITAFEPAPDQVAAIFNDITDRVMVEAERERLNQAINQLGEIVLITDVAANILYVNPAFTRITGYSREEVIGRNPRLLKSGVQDAAFYRAMWETLVAGRTWMGDITNRKKDGTLYDAQVSISPVLDMAGQVIHYVAVNVDVTQQKRAEEDRQNLQAQLNQMQKMESIGRLAGGIAHDFNNMLQAIQGYTELAIEQVAPDHPVLSDLLEIKNAAQRSAQLTKQLKAFARKQEISPQSLDLNVVIEGMLGILQRMIGENIHLQWTPAPSPCEVFMDPGQMDQIITNLCVNARDAVSTGGHIGLKTENVVISKDDPSFSDEGIAPGDYVILEVEDDGCGMDEETVRHLFEPFFTTKKRGVGAGLGLPTLYGITKQNKGAVRVVNSPGKGSTFRVYLPRSSKPVENGAATGVSAVDAGRGECILMIEDEPFILHAARRMLESLNYKVLAAGSPKVALELFRMHQDEVDLVLSDVIMPEMSGPETVARMLELRPGLRHLYMSGYTDNLLTLHGVKDSTRHVVQKPFSRDHLARAVRTTLDA